MRRSECKVMNVLFAIIIKFQRNQIKNNNDVRNVCILGFIIRRYQFAADRRWVPEARRRSPFLPAALGLLKFQFPVLKC